jgi:hypothetical protein
MILKKGRKRQSYNILMHGAQYPSALHTSSFEEFVGMNTKGVQHLKEDQNQRQYGE